MTVGKNLFSLNLNVVVMVRFPGIGEAPEQNELPVSTAVQPVSHDTPIDTSALIYANGETAEPGGGTAAFKNFARAHRYPPKSTTRKMLIVVLLELEEPP